MDNQSKERCIQNAFKKFKEEPLTDEQIMKLFSHLYEAGYYAGWNDKN